MSLQQLGWPRLFVQDMMRMSGSPVSSRADFGRGGIGRVRFLAAPGPARRRWSPSPRSGPTWSKANRWAWRVSHLLGCQLPLARGKNFWGELKHPQAAISRGLSSDLIWPGSSAHWGTKGWCCKKTTSNPWHHWWMPPCRMVLNNSVKSNMTYSHKPVLFSVWRLYFFASFQDCASGSTLRWTTKMPDKGTIQRFNVNSSHLSLQLLNLKAGGKKESVKSAAAIVLIFFIIIIIIFSSSDIRLIFFLLSSDILYLPAISRYLSVSVLLFGREGILFSTLIAWSLNSDCQQLGTWFSLFTDLSYFNGQNHNRPYRAEMLTK